MSRESNTERRTRPSLSTLVGAAVLGVLFTITVSSTIIGLSRFPTTPLWGTLLFLVGAIGFGAALRWLARRNRTHIVQAGALIGAGIMTGLLSAGSWTNPSQSTVVFAGGGLLAVVVVLRLTSNPAAEPGEPTGTDLLWRSLTRRDRDPADRERPTPEASEHATAESSGSTSGVRRRVTKRLGIPQYWLVVGTAFAICIPIALARPDFGIGLLSAFLTAYALWHRIDEESRAVDDGSNDG